MFDSGTDDPMANELARKANGASVTADRLITTSKGMMQKDFLSEHPVLFYLSEDEQPHYFLFNDTKGITCNNTTIGAGGNQSYRSLCVVTNFAVLFFTAGNQGTAVPLDAITDASASTGQLKHKLTLWTANNKFIFPVNNSIQSEEVRECADFINTLSGNASDGDVQEIESIEGLSGIWASVGTETVNPDEALKAEPQGAYVNRERLKKVEGILDPDEKIHFITRGSTVDVEGSGAGSSLFGDDRSRKSGTRGWVRAVITNKRVAIKIPQMLGTDQRSVSYANITSVDLDTGLVNKRLTLQTPGQTYHIEAQEPGKDEVRRATRFIRQQVEDANKPDVVQQSTDSEPDPLEQIEKLQDLKEQGVLSESEFNEKKQDLLDKI